MREQHGDGQGGQQRRAAVDAFDHRRCLFDPGDMSP
jgi:hypothetical protein